VFRFLGKIFERSVETCVSSFFSAICFLGLPLFFLIIISEFCCDCGLSIFVACFVIIGLVDLNLDVLVIVISSLISLVMSIMFG
jgi:hypothetical protein